MDSVTQKFYTDAFRTMPDEALLKRYRFAENATAEIAQNLTDRTNLSEENEQELLDSSNKLHIEMGACAVVLNERGVEFE